MNIINQFYQKTNRFFQYCGFLGCFLFSFFSVISTAGTSMSLAIILFSFLLTGHWKQKFNLLKNKIVIFIILIIIWAFIGVLYSHGTSAEGFNIASKYLKLILIVPLIYFINGNNIKIISLLSVFFFGVFLNLIAIYLNYYILPRVDAIVFTNPNWPSPKDHGSFAFYTIILCYISFYLAANVIKNKYLKIVLYFISLLAIVAELGLNSSRTGYMIELFLLGYLVISSKSIKKSLLIICFSIVLFSSVYVLSPIFHARVNNVISSTLSHSKSNVGIDSVSQRLGMYVISAKIIKNNPQNILLGFGTGSYKYETAKFCKNINTNICDSFGAKGTNQAFSEPENQFLMTLFENGIIGLVLLFILCYFVIIELKRLSGFYKNLATIVLIAIFVEMLFNISLIIISLYSPFIILLSILISKQNILLKRS